MIQTNTFIANMFFQNDDANFLIANRHYVKYLLQNGVQARSLSERFVSLGIFTRYEARKVRGPKDIENSVAEQFNVLMDICVKKMLRYKHPKARREFMSCFFCGLFLHTNISDLV